MAATNFHPDFLSSMEAIEMIQDDHSAYAEAALADEISIIGSTPKGRGLRNAAINRGAFKIGGLVSAGALSESIAREGLLSAACTNGYVADHGERSTRDVIEHGLKAGIASPREINGKNHTARSSFQPGAVSAPSNRTVGSLPPRTSPDKYGKPKFYRWGDDGPRQRDDELRRHVYRRESIPVRIKIKNRQGDRDFVNWYRVRDGSTVGWQPKQPSGYQPVPYVTAALDPFDPELKDDQIYWPEGEKDVGTLNRLNIQAFTFGGTGDGLPDGIDGYLAGRHLVILADNDDPGRAHAEKKAERAHAAGAASIRIVHFPELPPKADVSDFINAGGDVDGLVARVDAAPLWQPPNDARLETAPDPANGSGREYQLVMRCMADVQPEKIEWLWPGRIALGKQTLIGGEPGLGKSQVATALAAAATTSGTWPCDEGRAPLGSVIILSAEDDASDTIRPRLDAAGADVSRVHLISAVRKHDGKGRRTFNLQADLALLEKAIEQIGDVRLVIIDPVSSYLGKTDSHKNADVRSTLEPVGDMASRLRTSVVSITHFSKGAGQSAVNSFIGSIAFIAAARAAFIVTRDPDTEDDTRRLFVQAKNNLAADSGGLAFRLEQRIIGNDIVASAITWESEKITRTADEILAAGREAHETPERSEAEEFLRDLLSGGPRPAAEVEAEAKGAGVSWRTVRRAQKGLGIKPYRRAESGDGLGKSGRWYWALPNTGETPNMANFPYDGHVKDVATLGNSGHLSGEGGAQ
jgi:putative DNA primase/helicase